MKLSGKLLGIVGALGLLALAVMSLGLYGMSQLGSAIDNYIRIADRSEALTGIKGDMLELTIAEKNMLLTTDDAAMRAILEGDSFKNAMPGIYESIEQIKRSITPTSQAWVREVPDKLTQAARNFSEAVNTVAQITQENTAQRALDEYQASLALWNEYLAAAGPVFSGVTRDWESFKDNADEMMFAYSLRVNRVSFQRDIQLVLTARTAEERQAANESLLAGLAGFLELLEKAPQVFGGGRNPQFGPALAGQDSDGRAFAYSTSAVRDARLAFEAVLLDAVDRSHTQLKELADGAIVLQARLFWTMLISSVAGIVLVICVAYFIVSRLTRQLNVVIEGLDEASAQVASAADEISEASQSLAEGATEQAASLEETSAALEEMASMTHRNADNAALTNQTTGRTVELIEEGSKGVTNMSRAMGEITDSAEQISRIIKTIEGIAFQTNLLALNAAVEAARAGEAGMGFAVVADEVRNLAQRSATAVAQMDKVTQTNAAAAEECASASAELSGQAVSLKGMVDDLVALVTGVRRQSAGGAGRRAGNGVHAGNGSNGARQRLTAPSSARWTMTGSNEGIPLEDSYN